MARIFILAIALRLYQLEFQSLWGDEIWSLWFSSQSFSYLWNDVPKFETHPPFYYSILKLWRGVAGSSEFDLRLLSVIVNVLTIPLIYISARICGGEKHGRNMGALASFLFACSLFQLRYAQETRPYAFYTFAMALMVASCCYLIANPRKASQSIPMLLKSDRGTLGVYISLACGISLLQWFHNLGAMFILPVASFLVGWWFFQHRNKNLLINLSLTGLISFLLYLPFLKDFIYQMTQIKGGFWVWAPKPMELALRTINLYGESLLWINQPILRIGFYILTILPCAILGFKSLHKINQNYIVPVFLGVAAFLPYLMNVIVTYAVQPIFLERVMLGVQIPWYIILSASPFLIEKYRKAVILLLAGLAALSAAHYHYYTDGQPHNYEDWRGVIGIIDKNNEAEFPVISNINEAAFEYYAPNNNRVRPIVMELSPDKLAKSHTIGAAHPLQLSNQEWNEALKKAQKAGGVWFLARNNNQNKKLLEDLNLRFKSKTYYDAYHIQLILFTKE